MDYKLVCNVMANKAYLEQRASLAFKTVTKNSLFIFFSFCVEHPNAIRMQENETAVKIVVSFVNIVEAPFSYVRLNSFCICSPGH